MPALHCWLELNRLVNQGELYSWMLTWKFNLAGLIFFTSRYFGKSTSAYLRDFLSSSACLVSGSAAVCSEAHRSCFPMHFSPTSPYPSSSFLHPSAIAPSCDVSRCLGVCSGRLEAFWCSYTQQGPLSSGSSSLCPAREARHSSLPDTDARFHFWTFSVTRQEVDKW